jgi:sugar phosphate isomerase/epimerase
MQSLALSTSWNSSRHDDGRRMLEEAAALGFEFVELSHAVRYSLWPGVLKAVEAGIVRISSVHNFCPVPVEILRPSPNCYEFTDARANLRKYAIHATLETIRHAALVKAPAVILHLGWAGPSGVSDKLEELYFQNRFLSRPYVKTKVRATVARRKISAKMVARVRECLEPAVALAATEKIRLGIEIREDFEEFPNEEEMPLILNSFSAHTVGYWHDFGHAARKDNLGWHTHDLTLRNLQKRLVGCHVHDCLPPCRDHLPLGKGAINFSALVPLLPRDAIPVLELSPRASADDVISSKNLWKKFAASAA